jgi:CheY-like chemotaxis protein
MSSWLRLEGHSLACVSNGSEALNAALSFHPEVVIVDMGLPGMSGIEVVRALRRRSEFKEAKIAALSGYSDETTKKRAKEAGVDLYMVKPVEPQALDELFA